MPTAPIEAARDAGAGTTNRRTSFEATRIALRGGTVSAISGGLATFGWLAIILLLPYVAPFSRTVLRGVSLFSSSDRQLRGAAPGVVRIDGDRLVLSDGTDLSANDVHQAWIEHTTKGFVVVIELEGRRKLLVELPTHGEARSLLGAIGCDPSQQVARFPLASRLVRWGLGPFLLTWLTYLVAVVVLSLFIAPLAAWPWPLVKLPLVAVLWAIAALIARWYWRSLRPDPVAVGADGIQLGSSTKQRFLSYAQVARIFREPTQGILGPPKPTLIVETTAGDRIPLSMATLVGPDERRLDALERRIEESLQRFRQTGGRAGVAARLAREGRTPKEWRRWLGELLQSSDYRRPTCAEDDLIEVLSDDAVGSEVRLGAALALLEHDPKHHRRRVEAVRERCAHPKLRIALDGALGGTLDDRHIEELHAIEEIGRAESEAENGQTIERRSGPR
jgi:hypothetical protein